MAGSCSGCPSSTVTLRQGVERMLMHYIPEVKGIERVEDDELKELGKEEFDAFEEELRGKAKEGSS